ncbi:MAG: hypothetical protein GY701_31940 [Sulfitobacter sp.]|nr:hypothetical protein [Sulfitobacter sp.]
MKFFTFVSELNERGDGVMPDLATVARHWIQCPQCRKSKNWFAQLLTRLVPEDTQSLEALNRRLHVWLQSEYHHAPHRGLKGLTPLEQWAQTAAEVRFPETGLDLDELFLFETTRKVQKDRTVSLNGTLYEVDAALVGERITLRYDPAAPANRPIQIWHDHRQIQLA